MKKLFKLGMVLSSASAVITPTVLHDVPTPVNPHLHYRVADLNDIAAHQCFLTGQNVVYYYDQWNKDGWMNRNTENFIYKGQNTKIFTEDFNLIVNTLEPVFGGSGGSPGKNQVFEGINIFRLDNSLVSTWLYDYKTNADGSKSTFYWSNLISYYVDVAYYQINKTNGEYDERDEGLRVNLLETFSVEADHSKTGDLIGNPKELTYTVDTYNKI